MDAGQCPQHGPYSLLDGGCAMCQHEASQRQADARASQRFARWQHHNVVTIDVVTGKLRNVRDEPTAPPKPRKRAPSYSNGTAPIADKIDPITKRLIHHTKP